MGQSGHAGAGMAVMTVARGTSMTQAGFLDRVQAQEGRYGFDGVGPVAMSGGPGDHARIIGNIAFELRRRRGDGGPCEALASGAGIRTVGDAVRHPDALVACGGFGGRDRLFLIR